MAEAGGSRVLRAVAWLLMAAAALLALALVGLGVQALRMSRQLSALRADVAAVQQQVQGVGLTGPADPATALPAVRRVQSDTGRLRDLSSSPLWRVGSVLPWVGGSVDSVTHLGTGADEVSRHVVPALVRTALTVTRTRRAGPLDLAALSAQRQPLEQADTRLDRVLRRLAHDDRSDPTVRRAHDEVVGRLQGLRSALGTLVTVARLAPGMTGAQGPRHYLVALQTPAESRATGGLVASFLEVRVDHGRPSVVRSGTNRDFDRDLPDRDAVTVPGGYATTWGPYGAQRRWYSSNLSLDFPSAATVWAALYTRQYRVHLDGVVGVTPEALPRLLTVLGPVPLPDGGVLDSRNAAHVLEVALYARFPTAADEPRRNAYQLRILQALVARVFATGRIGPAYVEALRDVVANGSVRLASTRPQEQQQLARTAVAGVLPQVDAPFVAWSTQNIAGSKLDVYLHRSMTYRRRSVGTRDQVTALIALRNDAPARGLPPYVTYRADLSEAQRRTAVPGTNRLLVTTYLSAGARITSVTLDGRPVGVRLGTEKGHPLAIVDLVLPAGPAPATVVVTADEPRRSGPLRTVEQPVTRPDDVDLGQQGRRP